MAVSQFLEVLKYFISFGQFLSEEASTLEVIFVANIHVTQFSDVDDRVRYIIKSMGLTNYIWTTGPSGSFDTEGDFFPREFNLLQTLTLCPVSESNFFTIRLESGG